MVEQEEESRTLQIKSIHGATVSGKNIGQLNAKGPKSWDSTLASLLIATGAYIDSGR